MKVKLGNIIKLKRLSKNLSQEAICERIFVEAGVSLNQSYLSDIEKGKVTPSFETLCILIDLLEMDWDSIKDFYLHDLSDKLTLQKLQLLFYQKGNFDFCKRVSLQLFRQLKKSKRLTKQDRKTWILSIFYIHFYEDYKNHRLLNHLITMFENVSEIEKMNLLQDLFFFSKENHSYKSYSKLLELFLETYHIKNYNKYELHYIFAYCLYQESFYFESLLQCTKAQDIEKKLFIEKDKKRELLMLFGSTYIQLKMFEKAVISYEKCIVLCENSTDLFECYNQMGYSFYKLNNNDQAKAYWERALSSPALDRFSYLRILNRFCYMEITTNNLENAKIRFNQSKLVIDTFKEKAHREYNVELGLFKRNEAMFHIIKNDLKSAVQLLMESIELLEKTPYQDKLITSWLGVTYSLGKHSLLQNDSIITEEHLQNIISLKAKI